MRFCDFLNKLYERFPCSNQGQYVLEIFSALCGETNPVNSNKPSDYAFSSHLPSGLSGNDQTSRKRLYGGTSRYKGLTNPVKKHIKNHANRETFVAYCEASVAVEDFSALCGDFGVSVDAGRNKVFDGIFEQFIEFAKATSDNTSDSFVADYVTELIMSPVNKAVEAKEAETTSAPLCAGDDVRLLRQIPSQPHQAAFYEKLTHRWVLKNVGVAVWDGRYMEFINGEQTPLKTKARIEIEKTPPGGEVTITVEIEARHIEGIHDIIMDMKDSEGRLCFPDKRAELHLSVTVGWKK